MGVIIIIGPDIRHRLSRPITGKGARTPSWDSFRPVLDKGENLRPLILRVFVARNITRGTIARVPCVAHVWSQRRGRKVIPSIKGIRQDVFPVLFSSRVQSPLSFTGSVTKNQMLIACLLLLSFTPRHTSPAVLCARCLNGYRPWTAFTRVLLTNYATGFWSTRMGPSSSRRELITPRECSTSYRAHLHK